MTSRNPGVPGAADGTVRAGYPPTAGQSKPKDGKLMKAAQEFEAFFVATLLKQMRQAIPSSGLLHSRGEDMFRDMMDDQLGQDIAQGRGFGLADSLYRQLSLEDGPSGR